VAGCWRVTAVGPVGAAGAVGAVACLPAVRMSRTAEDPLVKMTVLHALCAPYR
jgi:hypothetical protein